MHYIVMDLEWNQRFPYGQGEKQPGMPEGEIVQIGAVKLNDRLETVDTYKAAVRPKYYTKIHRKVGKLTGLKTADLRQGISFPEAAAQLRRWCGEDFAFLTWSDSDVPMLRSNMELHRLEQDWIPDAYDVQLLFDREIAKLHRQLSLEAAVEMVGEEFLQGHDALNDALNTAVLCRYLPLVEWVARYTPAEFADVIRPGARGKAEGEYRSLQEASEDRMMQEFTCPRCGGTAEFCRWIDQGKYKKVAVAFCPGGSEYFARLRSVRQGKVFRVTRTVREMDDRLRASLLPKEEPAVAEEEQQ